MLVCVPSVADWLDGWCKFDRTQLRRSRVMAAFVDLRLLDWGVTDQISSMT